MVSLEVLPLLLLNVSLVADNNHRDTEISDLSGLHTTISCLHLSPCLLFLAAMSLSLASAEKEDWSPTEKTGGRRKYLISNSMTFNIL